MKLGPIKIVVKTTEQSREFEIPMKPKCKKLVGGVIELDFKELRTYLEQLIANKE